MDTAHLYLPGYDTIVDRRFYSRASDHSTPDNSVVEIICPHRYTLFSTETMTDKLVSAAGRVLASNSSSESPLQVALAHLPRRPVQSIVSNRAVARHYAVQLPRLKPEQLRQDIPCLYLQQGLLSALCLDKILSGSLSDLSERIEVTLHDPSLQEAGQGYRWGAFILLDSNGGLPATPSILDAFSITGGRADVDKRVLMSEVGRVAAALGQGLLSRERVSLLIDMSELAFESSAVERLNQLIRPAGP